MAGKKFQFRLENVRKHRHRETEFAERGLALAVSERLTKEQAVEQAASQIEKVQQHATTLGVTSPMAIRRFDAFRQDAQRRHEMAIHHLSTALDQEEQAREQLLHKKRDEEALNVLYEQSRTEYQKQTLSAETAFLDELAVSRFNRRNTAARS